MFPWVIPSITRRHGLYLSHQSFRKRATVVYKKNVDEPQSNAYFTDDRFSILSSRFHLRDCTVEDGGIYTLYLEPRHTEPEEIQINVKSEIGRHIIT